MIDRATLDVEVHCTTCRTRYRLVLIANEEPIDTCPQCKGFVTLYKATKDPPPPHESGIFVIPEELRRRVV